MVCPVWVSPWESVGRWATASQPARLRSPTPSSGYAGVLQVQATCMGRRRSCCSGMPFAAREDRQLEVR